MPRVTHFFEDGQYAHITTRTHGAEFHLASDQAKALVVESIRTYEARGFYGVLAYCVMANHFHLVLIVRRAGELGRAIGRLKGWTARGVHRLTQAQGPIWERRFDDNLIRSQRELNQVVAYVHFNPVRAGIVDRPQDYAWSTAFRVAQE